MGQVILVLGSFALKGIGGILASVLASSVVDHGFEPRSDQTSAISWREQVNFQSDDDEVRFVLDQHAKLDFHSASSLKQ
jgi:hypothetical protein